MIPKRQTASDELVPGSTLGKYEILRKLATGGMAELYLARARGVAGFEKTVVLKRILPHVAEDEGFVQMFLDEARLAATLQHPNIADVYDVGEVAGTPFFTMEYVHGQEARAIRAATRKRNEQVPIAMAIAIGHGVAAALDYAHGRTGADGRPLELVHRDVSSSNIVVSYDGAIKLLDFGIARAASHQHKTQVGTLKGKTPYMSPEQCRAQRLDRRSDLFSLGTVMFELTVGRRPFRGDNDFAIMEQIVHGEAPRPSTLVAGYPEELEAIVLKLLARRLDERYQSAEELLHDLEAFTSQHGLWVSPRQIGKYMRLLFADRIDAWERAANEGLTLGEHVAETITSESQRMELATPQSAHPRLLRLSQEIPAVGLPSREMAAVQPPFEDLAPTTPSLEGLAASATSPVFSAPSPVTFGAEPMELAAAARQQFGAPQQPAYAAPAHDPATPESYRLRPSRRGPLVMMGVMLVAAIAVGVYAWPMLFPKSAPPSAQATPPAAEPPATRASASETRPAAAAPAPARPAPAQPAPSAAEPPPAPTLPPEAAAQAAAAEASAKAGAPPAGAAASSAATTPPPAAGPDKRPAATKRTPPPPRLPAKAPPRVPSGKQPGTPKEDAWDRDSPFLPSSS
jgi:serine/threonine protein kinase